MLAQSNRPRLKMIGAKRSEDMPPARNLVLVASHRREVTVTAA